MKKLISLTALALILLTGCSGASDSTTPLESIAAYPEAIEMNLGEHASIRTVVTPSSADNTNLIWASSNPSVASVSDKGMVTALSDGMCTITAASAEYSTVSCNIQVTVGKQEGGQATAAAQSDTAAPEDEDGYVAYVEAVNASQVYPAYYLSESEVSSMGAEEIQFTINQIYAKNGYIFQREEIQNYFSKMSWYTPVSNNVSRLSLSPVDRSNLNLLVRYRDSISSHTGVQTSGVGWLWSRYAVDGSLPESYAQNLSSYDIQLLINTIYAKNGYIFKTAALQAMFEGQPWYHGVTADSSQISFSMLDKENLRLLANYR